MITGTNAFSQFLENAVNVFWALPWGYFGALLHDIFLFLDALLVMGIVYVLLELSPYRPKFYANPRRALAPAVPIRTLRDEGLKRSWEAILKKAESLPPQSLTLGIIEADSFVDTVLKTRLNLPGEHMSDRLERLDDGTVNTLDALWTAHRARNNVVHTPGYVLGERDARRFLASYTAFLEELGVI